MDTIIAVIVGMLIIGQLWALSYINHKIEKHIEEKPKPIDYSNPYRTRVTYKERYLSDQLEKYTKRCVFLEDYCREHLSMEEYNNLIIEMEERIEEDG